MPPRSARSEYETRLDLNRQRNLLCAARDELIANVRLAVFASALVLAWLAYSESLSWSWLAVPGAVFAGLVVYHQRVISRGGRAAQLRDYYQRSLDRLDGRWMEHGETGEEFLSDGHPYGADLDIVGRGSLFQLLCTARTRIGKQILGSWLLRPAAPHEVRERQKAIEELRDALDLREDLIVLGGEVDSQVHPRALEAWANLPPVFPSRRSLRVARIFLGLFVLSLGLWPIVGPSPVLLVFVAGLMLLGLWRVRLHDVSRAIEQPRRELAVLARVIRRLEREHWQSPLLRSLSDRFQQDGTAASKRLARLDRLVYLFELPHNQLFAPIAIATLWPIHVAHALERWRSESGGQVSAWLDAVGNLEALLALAAYAFEHPEDPFPQVTEGPASFVAVGLAHPLLGEEACVRNDVTLDATVRLLIVSGSNMSGKSTFLRMTGINAVLAQAGAPVRAVSLTMSPLHLGATMHVQDSLQSGASRFYAEIARLKHVTDLADSAPTMFLLDEILSGTNSEDRFAGAAAILDALLARGAVGMITTHDLALTQLAEQWEGRAINMHFSDVWRDGRLLFPYRLQPGIVRKGNALRLMEGLGLPVSAGDPKAKPEPKSGP